MWVIASPLCSRKKESIKEKYGYILFRSCFLGGPTSLEIDNIMNWEQVAGREYVFVAVGVSCATVGGKTCIKWATSPNYELG